MTTQAATQPRTRSVVRRRIKGDQMVTTETRTTYAPLRVAFADIVAAIKIENDDDYRTPWDDCDGYGHTATPLREFDYDQEMRAARGCCYSDGDRCWIVIRLHTDADHYDYDFFHKQGCSKQVARECVARIEQRILDQLVAWYRNGWNYYFVGGEYSGYPAFGLSGINSYEAAEEERVEQAEQIAKQMTADGYIIEGRPEQPKRLGSRWTREAFVAHLKRNRQLDCWVD